MQNFHKIKRDAKGIYEAMGGSQTFFFSNAKPKPSNLSDKSKNVSFDQNKTIKEQK